jgi:hypothetical protein
MRRLLKTIPLLLVTTAFIGEAFAVIGRPLTPMSYAGVARRTTRRTVAVGAAMTPGPIYW